MSCLGIDVCSTVQGSELDHLTVEGIEATDALGRAICQSELTVHCDRFSPLKLDLKLGPDDLEPVFSGAAWAGTVLWRAAAVLVDRAFLGEGAVPIEGRTCIELGCGLGVPGMACARLGAKSVALTEQPSLVDLLTRNVEANFSTEDVRAVSFPWSRAGAASLKDDFCGGDCFDVIVCCDCVYVPLYGDSWILLLEAIDALAGPHTDVLISLERRSTASCFDGVDPFLAGMKKNGFVKTAYPAMMPVEVFRFRRA